MVIVMDLSSKKVGVAHDLWISGEPKHELELQELQHCLGKTRFAHIHLSKLGYLKGFTGENFVIDTCWIEGILSANDD